MWGTREGGSLNGASLRKEAGILGPWSQEQDAETWSHPWQLFQTLVAALVVTNPPVPAGPGVRPPSHTSSWKERQGHL